MDKRVSKTQSIFAVAVVLLIVIGILFSQRSHVKRPLRLEKLTIGIPQELLASLLHLAVEKGYFAEEGLKVTVVDNYSSGKLALQSMLRGEIELTASAEVPIVFNSFEQQEFKVLATIGSSNSEPKVIARKDSGIDRPTDLKGKRIATQRASAVHFFLHLFMVKYGLTSDDVQLSFMKGKDLPDALAAGEIDAFSMREPFISQAREKVGAENVIIFDEPGLYLKSFNLVAINDLVRNKPEVLRRSLRALLKAESFASSRKDQAIGIMARRLKIEEANIAYIWPQIDLRVALGQALLVGLEDEARWAIANALIESNEEPNYLSFIHLNALKAVRPSAVSIIH